MSKRPDKTFLIQAGEHCFRVDLQRSQTGYMARNIVRGAKGNHSSAASNMDDFSLDTHRSIDVDGITALLKQGEKPAREISVLSDQVTAVIAEVDALGESDWHSAAQMEAQAVSGLSTQESVFASSRLSSEQGLMKVWTVQVAMREVSVLRAVVQNAVRGSRLVTVGHPAGIRIQSPMAQLENWSDFALYHIPDVSNIDLKGWNGASAITDALEDPEVQTGLLPSDTPATVIIASHQQFENSNALNWLDFSENSAIERWAAALAQAADPLSGRILGMPLISVPKPPISSTMLAGISAGFAAIMLLIILAHLGFNYLIQKNLEGDLQAIQAPADQLNTNRQTISSLKQELRDLDKELAAFYETEEIDVLAHRRRISALLAGISSGANSREAVILEISPEADLHTALIGMATSFNAPQDLARDIDFQLAEIGWRARLFRRTAKLLRDDGGPWTYEIRLSPSRPRTVEKAEEVTSDQKSTTRPLNSSNDKGITQVDAAR